MKKYNTFLVLFVAIALLFTGCSNNNSQDKGQNNTNTATTQNKKDEKKSDTTSNNSKAQDVSKNMDQTKTDNINKDTKNSQTQKEDKTFKKPEPFKQIEEINDPKEIKKPVKPEIKQLEIKDIKEIEKTMQIKDIVNAKKEQKTDVYMLNNNSNKSIPVKSQKNLSQTAGFKKITKYKDGTFTGIGRGYKGDIQVDITFSNDIIKSIKLYNQADDEEYFLQAEQITNEIVANQDTNVIAVSGATYTSNGIKNAINDALYKAINF